MSDDRARDDVAFRSLAAPGLDEDDLFLALQGLPMPGSFWGEGRPWARPDDEARWCEEEERRRRHEELLRKWERRAGDEAGITSPPSGRSGRAAPGGRA